MTSRRSPLGRLLWLFGAIVIALAGIVARLTVLQVGEHDTYRSLGLDQRIRRIQLPAARGRVVDRTGEPLAMSVEARDIYADPRFVRDPVATAAEIAPILGMRAWELRGDLSEAGSSFAYLARQVDEPEAARIEALELPGIGFLPTSKRYYPAEELAPQVLGYVGVDGTGLAGLEQRYQGLLGGDPGERIQEMDPSGQPIVSGVSSERPPVPGGDLVTTLDRWLQFHVQAALADAVRANQAKGGTVIVMDPHTGDVYAMATYPWFDPNAFEDYEQAELDQLSRNRAVTDAFEPGSVNKVITAAAAIEEHALRLDERLVVGDRIQIGSSMIKDSHPHPVARMTLGDIIAQSSNVGTIHVADRLGSGPLATYLARFGLGRTTGIDFPSETAGLLLPLYQWSDTSRATMAFGQGISATPMQMASVYATVANGGTWVQPRLASGTVDADGRYVAFDPSPTRRVVSPRTARVLTEMLAYAVEDGTGAAAKIDGYQVAGKTGTARKPYEDRAGYAPRHVASFMGFLPAGDPRVVVVAILDEPATVYGGIASAPLFQLVARYAIQRLSIDPGERVHLPPHALPVG